MAGLDLATGVSCDKPYHWTEGLWELGEGYAQAIPRNLKYKVVAYDFGIKYNILRCLVAAGCDVTVVPATFPAEEALAMNPDGIFLSNGPGDPEPMTAVRRTSGNSSARSRSSASASATSSWVWPWAARPSSSTSATMARICRSWTWRPARLRSPPRTTAFPWTLILLPRRLPGPRKPQRPDR